MSKEHLIQKISNAYLDGYRRQKAQGLRVLEYAESPEHRQKLAKADQHIAREFEKHTQEERLQIIEEQAISVGVAHAIIVACDNS